VTRITDVESLLAVLASPEAPDDDERVSMLAHHLQTAAQLALDAPDDVELQVAGLVHDIGTVLHPGTPSTHARAGAAALRPLVGSRVAELVAQHDQAKRYLVTTDPSYRSVLSAQSIATLAVQGAEMDDEARAAFEQHPDFGACIALRRADDAAKVPGKVVPPLESWRPFLDGYLRRR
jgi:predicted HD phosphohydrolase